MIAENIAGIQKLSREEKLILVEELCEQISNEPDPTPPSEEWLDELDRRLEEYERNPEDATTWPEAKARILASRKQ